MDISQIDLSRHVAQSLVQNISLFFCLIYRFVDLSFAKALSPRFLESGTL
jgi:hypothetical protein